MTLTDMYLPKPSQQGILRFLRYSCVGVGTFVIDLGLLYALTTDIHVAYYIATPISFFIGVSINYAISREAVFKETRCSWRGGYAHFILIAGCVGVLNYLLNLYWNFRVVGVHSGR